VIIGVINVMVNCNKKYLIIIVMENNNKINYFFGCDDYESNPPLCCRIMKKIGIYYGINKYFRKRNKKIYPK